MDFLKGILSDELIAQLRKAIEQHNGNEANKDNQIKLGNLGGGEYVSKGKHDSLQQVLSSKETELTAANELIAQLKKDTKGNEDLQGKITAYETENQQLQAELKETKLKAAIKVALLSAKAVDVDYLTFKLNEKLKEKGENLELDENDNIKGWNNKLEGLKTQFPNMFGSGEGDKGFKPLEPEKLPKNNYDKTVTKEQFAKMTYEERVKLKQANEERYRQLVK